MPRQNPQIIDEQALVELARLASDIKHRIRQYVARRVGFDRLEPS
jgi:hypothetical protein